MSPLSSRPLHQGTPAKLWGRLLHNVQNSYTSTRDLQFSTPKSAVWTYELRHHVLHWHKWQTTFPCMQICIHVLFMFAQRHIYVRPWKARVNVWCHSSGDSIYLGVWCGRSLWLFCCCFFEVRSFTVPSKFPKNEVDRHDWSQNAERRWWTEAVARCLAWRHTPRIPELTSRGPTWTTEFQGNPGRVRTCPTNKKTTN